MYELFLFTFGFLYTPFLSVYLIETLKAGREVLHSLQINRHTGEIRKNPKQISKFTEMMIPIGFACTIQIFPIVLAVANVSHANFSWVFLGSIPWIVSFPYWFHRYFQKQDAKKVFDKLRKPDWVPCTGKTIDKYWTPETHIPV